MTQVEFYRCELCGNIIAIVHDGGGRELTCCGQAMKHLEAGAVDAAKEKHVPAIVKEDGKIKVTVGSVEHPMLPEHFIQFVALAAEDRVMIKYLKPGDAPKAEFCEVPSGTVYEYCNLHGLWKADF
ncbi:desulfoferrodoxin [Megasphaera paucivorans]|uniref:Desulfoferrodoxin n=1 Tax=Megasphaera paucivorans TaxID=349095 RepID=A0A1G9USL5_9FIRM|nr:desulfoferrodoxin [Megasphaera paucivorans]SDM62909.1 superoxide reductase [Megasphaera paucivorans]